MATYDWTVDPAHPLVMDDRDINRAVLHYATHAYAAAEIYMNMAARRPEANPALLNTLSQAAAMTASIVDTMQWGYPLDGHLNHLVPANEDWMQFVATLINQASRLEVLIAQEGQS